MPSNGSKYDFSYQEDLKPAFKEQTLNNTTWDNAGGTLLGLAFIFGGVFWELYSGDASPVERGFEILQRVGA